MTEAEARAALAAFDAVAKIERWIAQQSWEAVPGGWTVPGELHGLRFRVSLVPGGGVSLRPRAWAGRRW